MKNLDNKLEAPLKPGDKVAYTKTYMFGKTGTIETSVILINGHKVLMENGDTFNIITRSQTRVAKH